MADDTEPLNELWRELADFKQDLAHVHAAAELQQRFDDAAKTSPMGHALVSVAVDLRRAGCPQPIPACDLVELGRAYLGRLGLDESASAEQLQAGIEWASSCGEDQLPLLIRVDGQGYRASPAIGCELDQPPVPQEIWEWLFGYLPPERLLRVAGAAALAGNRAVAERAWMRGTEAEEELIRRLAWAGLGELRIDEDDYDGAIEALERADGDKLLPVVRATPLYNLGLLYDRRGDAERARAYYERAIDADDPMASPHAAFNLGLLLGELGDADGAEAALNCAIKEEWFCERAVEALYALGNILRRLKQPDRARTYYQRAIDTGDHEFAPKAAIALGRLCEEEGADNDAMAAYEQALIGSDPEIVAKAIWRYWRLDIETNEADARTGYQWMLERLPDNIAPEVACQLGEWATWYGRTASAAIALFEQAMASGHREAAPRAALLRGWIAEGYRGHRKARAAYQRAIDSCHHEYAPKAANNLGALLANRGETDEALAAFALARVYPHAEIAPRAAFNTGVLLAELGRPDEARKAFQEAIDAGDRYLLPYAVARLARLLTQQHQADAAEALLRRWRETDDADLARDVAREVERLQTPSPPDPRRGMGFIVSPW